MQNGGGAEGPLVYKEHTLDLGAASVIGAPSKGLDGLCHIELVQLLLVGQFQRQQLTHLPWDLLLPTSPKCGLDILRA